MLCHSMERLHVTIGMMTGSEDIHIVILALKIIENNRFASLI